MYLFYMWKDEIAYWIKYIHLDNFLLLIHILYIFTYSSVNIYNLYCMYCTVYRYIYVYTRTCGHILYIFTYASVNTYLYPILHVLYIQYTHHTVYVHTSVQLRSSRRKIKIKIRNLMEKYLTNGGKKRENYQRPLKNGTVSPDIWK
jgi:hypothetical protein